MVPKIMKWITLTKITETYLYNNSHNNIYGTSIPIQQSILSLTKNKISLPISSIRYMEENNHIRTNIYTNLPGNNNYNSNGTITKNDLIINVEETIDQIQKQIHQLLFNDKMDEILK